MESADSQCVLAHFSALSGASSGLHYFSLDKRKKKGKGATVLAHTALSLFFHPPSPLTITITTFPPLLSPLVPLLICIGNE